MTNIGSGWTICCCIQHGGDPCDPKNRCERCMAHPPLTDNQKILTKLDRILELLGVRDA